MSCSRFSRHKISISRSLWGEARTSASVIDSRSQTPDSTLSLPSSVAGCKSWCFLSLSLYPNYHITTIISGTIRNILLLAKPKYLSDKHPNLRSQASTSTQFVSGTLKPCLLSTLTPFPSCGRGRVDEAAGFGFWFDDITLGYLANCTKTHIVEPLKLSVAGLGA